MEKKRFTDMQQLHEIEEAVRENVLYLLRLYGMDERTIVVNVQQLRGGYGRYAPKAWTINGQRERDEICINPDQCCIQDEAENVDSLLHEICHLYCNRNGIKETSRNGYYHNKKFKEVAETRFGLKCIRKSSGYNTTSEGNEEKLLALNARLPHPFDGSWYRNQKPKSVNENSGTHGVKNFRFACPKCGQQVRVTARGTRILCMDCRVQYKWIPRKDRGRERDLWDQLNPEAAALRDNGAPVEEYAELIADIEPVKRERKPT